MSANPRINRNLEDAAFDRIDHALGRPLDPGGQTYRNVFLADGAEAAEMAASDWWRECAWPYGGRLFTVTEAGRAALAAHLLAIGDKHRLFTVTFEGQETEIAATSPRRARYEAWRRLSDVRPRLTFGAFAPMARVRRAG